MWGKIMTVRAEKETREFEKLRIENKNELVTSNLFTHYKPKLDFPLFYQNPNGPIFLIDIVIWHVNMQQQITRNVSADTILIQIEGGKVNTEFVILPKPKGNRTLLDLDFLQAAGVVLDVKTKDVCFGKYVDIFPVKQDNVTMNSFTLRAEGQSLSFAQKTDHLVKDMLEHLPCRGEVTLYVEHYIKTGVNAAKNATLTFMVGAKETEFNAVKDILLCMGQNAMHCGPVGTGQGAKICNNMALAISMIGTSEAMNLGIRLVDIPVCVYDVIKYYRLGLDPKMMGKILNMSSGRSWASEVYNPVPGVMENVPAASNYHGGFGTALMAKDLGLAQQAALKTASPTPMGSLAHQIYRMMMNSGFPDKDFSSVFLYLQEGHKFNGVK
ncbi:UNVERIFIED_CONTAM: 3-hydroxyisobutyrate dehydrogenase [Trichonephila clavipes]